MYAMRCRYCILAFSDVWLGQWAEASEREQNGELSQSEDSKFAAVYGGAMFLLVTGVLAGS